MTDDLFSILAQHRALDDRLDEPGQKVFISDWNGSHPFVREYIGSLADPRDDEIDANTYQVYQEDAKLLESIAALHQKNEGLVLDRRSIIPGSGSTAMLASVCFWLFSRNAKEIFYIPPLYYTTIYMLKTLGFATRAVSGRHPYEPRFSMNLPDSTSTLFIADPVWYAGRAFDESDIESIRSWQVRTESWVVVDGSFQYMRWDGRRSEATSRLIPSRTLRIICPSKSLSIHGYRFAYMLLPSEEGANFQDLHFNLHGAASAADLAFARKAIAILTSDDANRKVTDYIQWNYHRLVAANVFREHIVPNCGYFMFGELARSHEGYISMGPSHFGQSRYFSYARVNLLNELAVSALLDPD